MQRNCGNHRKATGAEIIFDHNLRERYFGISEGMLHEERDQMYPEIYEYEGKPPEGESFKELEERVWKTIAQHKKNHKHKNVVIVTHGGPVRTFLKRLKNWDFPRMMSHYTKNAEIIELGISDPCKNCGSDIYEQDPDVFDTWFSSGQWPFATLLALSKKDRGSRIEDRSNHSSNIEHRTSNAKSDFQTFYPTDVMAPGHEILFLWVARMIMLGLYRTGNIPFKTVYLHGIVRDKDRQKMSKSKGNVIDPLGVAELYGTDAVRMSLIAGTAAGNDPVVSEEKIKGYRNFTTKIWNIARFIEMNSPSQILGAETWEGKPQKNAEKSPRKSASSQRLSALTREDKKNLKELEKVKKNVADHIEKLEFHLAAETLYHYIWHTVADKIIEEYKPRLRRELSGKILADRAAAYQTLEVILLESLKKLHPFMPFITEEIFQKFKPGELLMVEKW